MTSFSYTMILSTFIDQRVQKLGGDFSNIGVLLYQVRKCFGTADFLFAGRKFFLNFRIACFQFHCFSFIICRHSSIALIGKPSEHMILVNMLK